MLPKATLLALIAFVANAAAVPAKRAAGISIPLHKRGSLTTDEGVFDRAKAIRAFVITQNKYRQNLINLKANGGTLRKGVVIKDPASIPSEFAKRQSEPLDAQLVDVEWAGKVSIGSPPVEFLIDFDTGSSDFWVPSVNCTSAACEKKHKYDPTISTTSKPQSGNFKITYEDGHVVQGPVFTDTVEVAGIRVTGQAFSPVTDLSASFVREPSDGILGLGFPAISNLRQNPFFNTAISQGAVSEAVFGFKLAENGSELFLGGTNKALISGDIEFHKVNPSTGYWQIPGASVKVDGKKVVDSFETVIDSGSTIMTGPPADVKAVYDAVGGKLWDPQHGLFTFPCNSPPAIAFNWGGKDWAISPENINRGETELGSGQCVGALAAGDLSLGKGIWLLGDSFMKNVYTAFSFNDTAIGFAELA